MITINSIKSYVVSQLKFPNKDKTLIRFTIAFICFLFVCLINGSIPFLLLPTLGQSIGSTIGWAQAFINESLFSIHSYNFGYPEPAARSFGLLGV